MKPIPVNEQAQGILLEFTPDEIEDFFNEAYFIKQVYEEEDEEVFSLCRTEEDKANTRLCVIAITLHRIAKKYGRRLKKISDKYPRFDILCHQIAKEVEEETNVTEYS